MSPHSLWYPLIVLIFITGSQGSYFESKLLGDLFSDYDKNERPVINDSEAVTVTMGLSLHQIMDVDEKNQIMTISIWARQKWNNPYLKWDKEKYGNVSTINVPSSKVWIPDLVLYNNADDGIDFRGYLDSLVTRVQLLSDGTNKWLAPVMLRSKCKINVKYFPFDTQICQLKFGSWTYDGLRLDVQNESSSVDLGSNIPSAEWWLEKAPVKRNVLKYFCCPEPYPDVTFYLYIHRRTLFYMTNLILPLVVISVLIAFIFTLPPESGERISLSITILLAMTVFMLLVTETIPPTSEVIPLIAKLYMAAMFETALALVATCIVLRCYHSKANEVPGWMKRIFVHKLARFFGIQKSKALLHEEHEEEEQLKKKQSQAAFLHKMMFSMSGLEPLPGLLSEENSDVASANGAPIRRDPAGLCATHAGQVGSSLKETDAKTYINYRILENLEMITDNMLAKDKVDRVQEQWHVIAMVLDRLAVWSFFGITIIAITSILSQSPGYVP